MKKPISCTICHSLDNIGIVEKRLSLYRCGRCNHTFTFVSKAKEKYNAEYFLHTHRNWFSHPNIGLFEKIYQTVRSLIGNKKISMLDVGCGTGDLLKYIASKRIKSTLVGIDLAPNDPYPGVKFIKGDFFKSRIEGKFNVVSTLGTIEHIHDPNLFVRKMNQLTAPGGILIIMTIDSSSLIYSLARLLHLVGLNIAYNQLFSDHHLQHYNKDSLQYLITQNGLEVISRRNHNFPIESVDVPQNSIFPESVYLFLTAIIFSFSSFIEQGMLQTIMCRKK